MKNLTIAVIKLLGTNAERDVYEVLSMLPGAKTTVVSSRERILALADANGILIPGGFYRIDLVDPDGDCISSDLLTAIADAADEGKPILGIAQGFKTLVEIGVLPGKLLQNKSGRFICKWTFLRVCREQCIFTKGMEGAVIRIPIAHAVGRYDLNKTKLDRLRKKGQIVMRYCDSDGSMTDEANPDGSVDNIAAVRNERGNVLGMMPYPERASRENLSSTDGLAIIQNFVEATKEMRG